MPLFDAQTRALLTARLFQPIDAVFGGLLCLGAITVVYWWIFGHPSAEQLLVVLLAAILATMLWLIVVLFRLGVMLLRMRADIVLLPNQAAKIAEQMRTAMRNPPTVPSGP